MERYRDHLRPARNVRRLIELQATAQPGGDYDSPDMGRFIDSVAFFTVRARPEASELTLPK